MASVSAMTLAASVGPSFGQTVEELQQQIDALQKTLDAIKAAQGIDAIAETPVDGPRKEADLTADAPDVEPLKVEAKGAPRFSGDGFSKFKIRGRVMADFAIVGDPDRIGTVENGTFRGDPGLGTTSEIRRARLGVQGGFGDWAYKFEADFSNNDANVKDAYIRYTGFGPVTLTAGHLKTPVSMEENTSSLNTAFMERGMFTDAFGFSYELGATASVNGSNWSWKTGVFAGGGLSGDDEASGYTLASRAHYAIPTDNGFVHVGGSAEFRDKGEQVTRVRNRPFMHTTNTRLIDTGTLDSRSSLFMGAELAASHGPFSMAAEYGSLDVKLEQQAGRNSRAHHQGAFVHLVTHLTGEKRGYKMSEGTWSSTSPLRPLGGGGFGALALNLGFDWLDLNDAEALVSGGEQMAYLAGLAWTPVDHVRFMINFSHIEIDDSRTHVRLGKGDLVKDSFGLNTFGLRTQINW